MPSLRFLHHRQRGLCAYCARETVLPPSSRPLDPNVLYASRDHLVPTSRGGDNHRPNLRMACIPCNQIKRDMLPSEWEEFMRDNPEWWRRPVAPQMTATETIEFLRNSGAELVNPRYDHRAGRWVSGSIIDRSQQRGSDQ